MLFEDGFVPIENLFLMDETIADLRLTCDVQISLAHLVAGKWWLMIPGGYRIALDSVVSVRVRWVPKPATFQLVAAE